MNSSQTFHPSLATSCLYIDFTPQSIPCGVKQSLSFFWTPVIQQRRKRGCLCINRHVRGCIPHGNRKLRPSLDLQPDWSHPTSLVLYNCAFSVTSSTLAGAHHCLSFFQNQYQTLKPFPICLSSQTTPLKCLTSTSITLSFPSASFNCETSLELQHSCAFWLSALLVNVFPGSDLMLELPRQDVTNTHSSMSFQPMASSLQVSIELCL